MNSSTIKRLRSYYREIPWLKQVLQHCEHWVDEVSRQNADFSHLDLKIGKQISRGKSTFMSALLVSASGSRFVELTPRSTRNPLIWLLSLFGLVERAHFWTLYGSLKRLQEGKLKNPHAMLIEEGKWIVILREREVKRMFRVFAQAELAVTILKVRRDTNLLSLMFEYDRNSWQQTQVLERKYSRTKIRKKQEVLA